MVRLPQEFIAIRYAGYYLNLIDMQLYSLKRSGTLNKLKHNNSNPWRLRPGFTISHEGTSRAVSDAYLAKLRDNYLAKSHVFEPDTIIAVNKQESKGGKHANRRNTVSNRSTNVGVYAQT